MQHGMLTTYVFLLACGGHCAIGTGNGGEERAVVFEHDRGAKETGGTEYKDEPDLAFIYLLLGQGLGGRGELVGWHRLGDAICWRWKNISSYPPAAGCLPLLH